MAKGFKQSLILLLLLISIRISLSVKLQSSQVEALLRIQSLLNFPSVLSNWSKKTKFCNLYPSPSVTVVCYGNNLTQLHISGDNKGAPKLPHNFSIDSLVTTLANLPSLKVLTLVSLGLWGSLPGKIEDLSSLEMLNISSNFLDGKIPEEISSLTNLQGIVLDDNMFSGEIPDILGSFPALNALSLRNNSFDGSLPKSLGKLSGLRVLTLANNKFSGEIPDLRGLKNLEKLNLENNSLGPDFPQLENKLVILILRNNKFRSGIPAEIESYYQLKNLDISSNKFMGPFPTSLLSLPSINHLNIAGNKLTGTLSRKVSCNYALKFVDLSSNLLTGDLPDCLESKSKNQIVRYKGNCLNMAGDGSQHEYSFCRNEALAAGIVTSSKKHEQTKKAILASCIVGGISVLAVLIFLVLWLFRRVYAKKKLHAKTPRVISEKAATNYTSSKLLTDARYISQTMKLGALGIPAYRTFSLEELEIATNKFASTAFMGEGSQGQMYRGQLIDGSLVAIRCLKLKENHPIKHLMPHVELIANLRHRHLVSAIGHCFEYYLEDSTVSSLFLVFEYVPNGTLRSWISAGRARRKLTWSQRIAASIGIAKGIEFLHTGITPGIFSNNLRITDVLVDQNLSAKISSYNLPLLAENMGMVTHGASTRSKEAHTRIEHEDKMDIYDFGVILLEMIMGIQIKTRSELNAVRNQVQASLEADEATRRSTVAEEIRNTYSDESLKTMMEICTRCLLKDPSLRPSIEDIMWNLQFASQVQEAWQGGESRCSSSSTRGSSPASPLELPKLRFTIH
ncbi:hypothetical protein SOVF_114850 isoform A [Spinacia oleracea]|uniref:Probable inactive leucine-rich repeat receptor-like protein kinase At3g03770 isoform X2 n=1 Tax=Spinacia oleracea TaxID=3562 RepID=A0A9R0KAQ9_SPIOL|nr:probable inactive leucine-rich repeat receptor-like protein kinase At3g03770 isoform X2 [Spinacia oleracea]KNA13635.1 hypothetical protein SOVF_114850 isoform A [Spinacia oleracea]